LNPNEKLLKRTLKEIEPIIDDIVFVGGITTHFYLSENSDNLRTTIDVDATSNAGVTKHQKMELQLIELGFQPEPEVRCRYVKGDLVLDLMPADPKILGFSNKWYRAGVNRADSQQVGKYEINILPVEYFFASKIEAFNGRGKNDFYGSKDMEDLISILGGRVGILEELASAESDVKSFILENLREYLKNAEFAQSFSGNLPSNAKDTPSKILADLKELVKE
jgi:hypothetical protein